MCFNRAVVPMFMFDCPWFILFLKSLHGAMLLHGKMLPDRRHLHRARGSFTLLNSGTFWA